MRKGWRRLRAEALALAWRLKYWWGNKVVRILTMACLLIPLANARTIWVAISPDKASHIPHWLNIVMAAMVAGIIALMFRNVLRRLRSERAAACVDPEKIRIEERISLLRGARRAEHEALALREALNDAPPRAQQKDAAAEFPRRPRRL